MHREHFACTTHQCCDQVARSRSFCFLTDLFGQVLMGTPVVLWQLSRRQCHLSYWEVEKHSIQVNLTNWYARARFSAFNHQIEHRHPSQYLAPPIVAQTMMAVFGRADGQLLASSHPSLSPTPCRRPGPFYIAHLSSLMSYLFPLPHPCQGEEYDLPQLSLC